jgi:hypothetical protein
MKFKGDTREIIRPGTFSDGLPRMGTTPDQTHSETGKPYLQGRKEQAKAGSHQTGAKRR